MNEQTNKYKARPTEIPEGTYTPFLLAVSVLFMGWGLITHWILSVAGLVAFFIVLWRWIKEIIYERKE